MAVAASEQVNPALSAANPRISKSVITKPTATPDTAKATRARVINQTQKVPPPNNSSANQQSFQAHAKANFKNRARLESLRAEISAADNARVRSVATGANAAISDPKAVTNKIGPVLGNNLIANATTSPTAGPAASQIYRVGVGDVLDVPLNDYPAQASTLFTVLSGGMLEYPLAGRNRHDDVGNRDDATQQNKAF